MKLGAILSAFVPAAAVAGCATSKPEAMGDLNKRLDLMSFYLPNADAPRVLSVTTTVRSPPPSWCMPTPSP